jgi:ArsR family transcriptional regulator
MLIKALQAGIRVRNLMNDAKWPDFSKKTNKSSVVITRFLATMNPVMSNAVTFCRALADDTRWRIVRLVMDRALCVCELADILEMPQSSVSSHVQIIRKADLLESERRGKWTYFRIHPEHVPLLARIIETFPNGRRHNADMKKAKARLLNRESSCCPGPVKLTETP